MKAETKKEGEVTGDSFLSALSLEALMTLFNEKESIKVNLGLLLWPHFYESSQWKNPKNHEAY
jgi:hypothetical protein